MTSYNFPPEIQEWIDIVELNVYATCNKQKALIKHIKHCFEVDDIYIDTEQLNNYMKICNRYIPFKLLPWEKFIITLHDCTYWSCNNEPRWPILFVMTGRGNGKDGCIATEAFCLSSPYNHIREYDVDICANNEEQAMRPVEDLTGWLDDEASRSAKIKKFYHWTKQIVTSKKTKAKIKGRTNNPKGRDGMRSGLIVFNEVHQYENYDNINVFKTGLGKKANPRQSYYTTNGEVREGPLACSAASIIFCAGDVRTMGQIAMLMIHNCMSYVGYANSAKMRKAADDNDKINQSSIEAYKAVSKLDEDEIKELMDAETWITAQEALDYGFATEIADDEDDAEGEIKQSVNPLIHQMILDSKKNDSEQTIKAVMDKLDSIAEQIKNVPDSIKDYCSKKPEGSPNQTNGASSSFKNFFNNLK